MLLRPPPPPPFPFGHRIHGSQITYMHGMGRRDGQGKRSRRVFRFLCFPFFLLLAGMLCPFFARQRKDDRMGGGARGWQTETHNSACNFTSGLTTLPNITTTGERAQPMYGVSK